MKAVAVIVLVFALAFVCMALMTAANGISADLSCAEWCRAHGGTGAIIKRDGTRYCVMEDSPVPQPIPSWVGVGNEEPW